MVLENQLDLNLEEIPYASLAQFEILKKKKKLRQIPQLTTPLWLTARMAKELGYNAGEEDFLLEPLAPEPGAIYGRLPQPTVTTPSFTPTEMPTAGAPAVTPIIPQPTAEPPLQPPEISLTGDYGLLYQDYLRTGGTLDVVSWGAAGAPLRPDMETEPTDEELGKFLEDLVKAGQIGDVENILRFAGTSEEEIDQIVGVEVRQNEFQAAIAKTFPQYQYDLEGFANLVETDFEGFITQMQTGGRTKEKVDLLRLIGFSPEIVGQILPVTATSSFVDDFLMRREVGKMFEIPAWRLDPDAKNRYLSENVAPGLKAWLERNIRDPIATFETLKGGDPSLARLIDLVISSIPEMEAFQALSLPAKIETIGIDILASIPWSRATLAIIKDVGQRTASKVFEEALSTGLDRWIAFQGRLPAETRSMLGNLIVKDRSWLIEKATQNFTARLAEKRGIQTIVKSAVDDTLRDIEMRWLPKATQTGAIVMGGVPAKPIPPTVASIAKKIFSKTSLTLEEEQFRVNNREAIEAVLRATAPIPEKVTPAPEVIKRITRTTKQQDIQATAKILSSKLKESGIPEEDIADLLDVYNINSKATDVRASLTFEQLRNLADEGVTEDNVRKLTREILAKEFGVPTSEVDLVLGGGSRVNPRLDIKQAEAKAREIDNLIKSNLPSHKDILAQLNAPVPDEATMRLGAKTSGTRGVATTGAEPPIAIPKAEAEKVTPPPAEVRGERRAGAPEVTEEAQILIEQVRNALVETDRADEVIAILPDGIALTGREFKGIGAFQHLAEDLPPVQHWLDAGVVRTGLETDGAFFIEIRGGLSQAQFSKLSKLMSEVRNVRVDFGFFQNEITKSFEGTPSVVRRQLRELIGVPGVPAEAIPKAEAVPEAKEIIAGIAEVKEVPTIVAEEKVTPPIPPKEQPPKTVEVPMPPPSPDARNRIITQSQEVIKQSLPGALNRLIQKIPGIRSAMRWERPALRAFAENNPHLVIAQVAEVAARSDVASRQVASRLPLFKQLHDVFGERVLRGEKSDIKFVGTEEQALNPITGTLLDIAQNPELYELTPTHLAALEGINKHNDFSLDYVVNGYGAEIGRFAPKPNGAFLSNVDIDEGIIDWLGSETRAVALGRGKTRYWQTARDRMVSDKTFQPELDIKRLIEGMDSFKASAAGGVTFREIVGGKTRLEAMQETHPELYNRMMTLRAELQALKSNLANLETRLEDRVTEFLESPAEDADLAELQEALDVRLQKGKFVEFNVVMLQDQIDTVRGQIKELRTPWKVANLKPYVFVQEGLYRYFKPPEAKYIIDSRRTTNNPTLMFIERWRGQAFSGDFSPFAIQGSIGVLADPIGSLQATWGGIQAARANKDLFHSVTIDGLIDDVNSDIEGWAEFASLMGRELTGIPREYAAGFLSSIPGFDKFTERTYIVVTRGTKNLYDRTWQGLVKSGVPEIEAKVAAIEQAMKVYPLVNPAKLGQSQARAAVLRAIPTSYSFIRQPASLISQAAMGYAKYATFQKVTPQERVAVKLITIMAASILITSATSAVLTAIAQGKDDDEVWQAFLDAINPDPYNGKFASIIIGDFRIPLGGPYRAIFRAIYPQEVKGIPFPVPFAGIPNYVFNRITPAVKTQINLLRNKDYHGKQIVKGKFPENILRALLYEIEGALPLSAGELMGGIRREEFPEEIGQQAAAQFVGVNLIKLDNTYFHKLVRNQGLPKSEAPPLYSTKRPYFTKKDTYGKVTSVLSDETLDEVKKRKGYPKEIALIIAARDLKREVDLLPNYSPVSLKPEDVLGEKGYYTQWTQRQALVEAGDDAEWVTQELVGGRYKERTYKGEAAVKAFDKEYPQAERGNMSQRQYALLVEYHALTDAQAQKQFLIDHPEITINPRIDYLKTHPKENAQLAVWGQANLLTLEAYNQFKAMIKELDIPDSAIPVSEIWGEKVTTLPSDALVNANFERGNIVEEFGANSWEDKLHRAKNPELNEWLGLGDIDTPLAALELKTEKTYRATWRKLEDEDDPDYVGNLDDKIKDKDGLTARDRAIAELKATKISITQMVEKAEKIVGTPPRLLEQQGADCGNIAVSYIMQAYGLSKNIEDIIAEVGNGLRPANVVTYLEKNGFRVEHGVSMDLAGIKASIDRGDPVIVKTQDRPGDEYIHWSVIYDYDEETGTLSIYNGLNRVFKSVMTEEEFLGIWGETFQGSHFNGVTIVPQSREATISTDMTWTDIDRKITAIEKGTDETPIPDEIVNAYVSHYQIVDKTSGNSAEAKLNRYDNPGLNDFMMSEAHWGKDKAEPLDEDKSYLDNYLVPRWRIDVKYTKEDAEYQAILDKFEGREESEQAKAYMDAHEVYRKDDRRRQGYGLSNSVTGVRLPINQIEDYVTFYEIPQKGKRRERFVVENLEFARAMFAITGADIFKTRPEDVPNVAYDDIYDQYQDTYDLIDSFSDANDKINYKDNTEKDENGLTARDRARNALIFTTGIQTYAGVSIQNKILTQFGLADIRRDAYGNFVPDQFIEDYVGYYTIIGQGKPKGWEEQTGTEFWWEDDWFMKEHPEFYKEVYLNPKYWDKPHQRKDYRLVPTREIGAKYLVYVGLDTRYDQDKYRLDNPDLDEWGSQKKPDGSVFIWTKTMTQKRQRLSISEAERISAEIEKRLAELKEAVGSF